MKVLVFCENSDVVGSAFRARGHDVTSSDLEPSAGSPNHYQGDGRWLLQKRWDLVVAHPPCQHLTNANLKPKPPELEGPALALFQECLNANAPRVAVENPMPFKHIRAILGEPSCIVQPFQFGDVYRKKTCWWLRGLPPLLQMGDAIGAPRWVSAGYKGKGLGVASRPKDRAHFWPGMARAMARQWGG